MTRVHVIATGGTISSHRTASPDDDGEWRSCTGDELVDEVRPALAARLGGVEISVEDAAAGPSSNLTVEAMARVADLTRRAVVGGATGVVVLHGTDTLESTAYVLDLLLGDLDAPVVVTGSMRVHSHADPDGPANIVDSVLVAADEAARGRGTLVCLDGIVHRAVHVHKDSAVSVHAFSSAPFEPIGRVDARDSVRLAPHDGRRTPGAATLAGPVPLVGCYPGIPPAALEHALAAPGTDRGGRVPGVVVEAFGDLNAPQQLWAPIHHAWKAGVLVVLASRPFTDTSTGEGLDLLGAVGAGGLTAQKAMLAAMAALGTTTDRDAAADFVRRCAIPLERGDWAT
jgi:L-asparaginase